MSVPSAASLDVTSWQQLGQEWEGRSDHFWLAHPESGWPWLWKPAEGRRLVRSEHVAELAVSRLARALTIPCAEILLAERNGVAGCLSRDIKGRDETLEPGEWMLNAIDPEFDAGLREPALHSVTTLQLVLNGVSAPAQWLGPQSAKAFDVMAGYLTLDALVLNRDRHAANWAVLRAKKRNVQDCLAPLYDNASALGLSLTENNVRKRLSSRGVAAYVEREDWARAFAKREGRTDSLLKVATEALGACAIDSRHYWLEQVRLLDDALLQEVLDVPGLSEVRRTFAAALVLTQRDRILEEVSRA